MTSCEFGRQETGAIGGNKIKFEENIGPAPNPLKFPFNKWPVYISHFFLLLFCSVPVVYC